MRIVHILAVLFFLVTGLYFLYVFFAMPMDLDGKVICCFIGVVFICVCAPVCAADGITAEKQRKTREMVEVFE